MIESCLTSTEFPCTSNFLRLSTGTEFYGMEANRPTYIHSLAHRYKIKLPPGAIVEFETLENFSGEN